MLKIFKDLPMSSANLGFYKYPCWAEHDGFSYCGNRFLAARLIKKPEKLSLVQDWLKKFSIHTDSLPYTLAWLNACEQGVENVYTFAIQDTDFGQVIRSCSPLSLMWTAKERMIFLHQWWNFRDNGIAMDIRFAKMPKDGQSLL